MVHRPATSAAAPIRVESGTRTVHVVAVVPCFNRPEDLAALAGDFAACALEFRTKASVEIALRVLVIDNASSPPLEIPELPESIPVQAVRLTVNTGGSGGYNAGMALALADDPEFLWLVDSDARVQPETLAVLLDAMLEDKRLAVIGPVLTDETGEIQEVGGAFDRRTGRFGPAAVCATGDAPVRCDYVAACCALVRAETVKRVGLMPDVFLNADDVEWCLRLAKEGAVAVHPGTTAAHPRFDRFATFPRYFGARNGFGPIEALGLSRIVRFRRGMRETARAINQCFMARPDIAVLHLTGLRDAIRNERGFLPSDLTVPPGPRPLAELVAAIDELNPDTVAVEESLHETGAAPGRQIASLSSGGLAALMWRMLSGPRFDVALVPAKGSPSYWFTGRHMIHVSHAGFSVHRTRRRRMLGSALAAGVIGTARSLRLAFRRARIRDLPTWQDAARLAPVKRNTALSVVILSHNRREAVIETLARLHDMPAVHGAEIIVVDNASTDGTREAIGSDVRVLGLDANEAIAGFNRGVDAATGDLVLILDDDARPEAGALTDAIQLLASRPEIGAVTLLPFHPRTGRVEWPFGERLTEPTDDWPVMGCCNLVRRDVWLAVGGYEESFFLYRNDTDLAMKILEAGRGVHFNPAWRCEHDSPAAARKSVLWCRLATRNWIWLARRHGRGWSWLVGVLAGWVWAHREAGFSIRHQWSVIRGAWAGFSRGPKSRNSDGRAFARLLRLRFSR